MKDKSWTKGYNAYAMLHGQRIRMCYNKAKVRALDHFRRHAPSGADWREWIAYTVWAGRWQEILIETRDEALQQALENKRKEKACRKQLKLRS